MAINNKDDLRVYLNENKEVLISYLKKSLFERKGLIRSTSPNKFLITKDDKTLVENLISLYNPQGLSDDNISDVLGYLITANTVSNISNVEKLTEEDARIDKQVFSFFEASKYFPEYVDSLTTKEEYLKKLPLKDQIKTLFEDIKEPLKAIFLNIFNKEYTPKYNELYAINKKKISYFKKHTDNNITLSGFNVIAKEMYGNYTVVDISEIFATDLFINSDRSYSLKYNNHVFLEFNETHSLYKNLEDGSEVMDQMVKIYDRDYRVSTLLCQDNSILSTYRLQPKSPPEFKSIIG